MMSRRSARVRIEADTSDVDIESAIQAQVDTAEQAITQSFQQAADAATASLDSIGTDAFADLESAAADAGIDIGSQFSDVADEITRILEDAPDRGDIALGEIGEGTEDAISARSRRWGSNDASDR